MSWPNTPTGVAEATYAAGGDRSRVWINGDRVYLLDFVLPAIPNTGGGGRTIDARDYGLRQSASSATNSAALQAAFDAAKASPRSKVFAPAGEYDYIGGVVWDRAISLEGDGRATVLNNVGSGTFGFRVQSPSVAVPYIVGVGEFAGLYMTGTSAGPAIEYDTESNWRLRSIYIVGCPGIGLHIGRTSHASVLTLDQVKIQQCAKGIYGRGSSAKQINALNISASDISGNGGNGVDVIASLMNIERSVIQGNSGYGILIDPSDDLAAGGYSAYNVRIIGNYLERNAAGELRIVTGVWDGGVTRTVNYLEVIGNLFAQGASATRPAVTMTQDAGGTVPNSLLSAGVRGGVWASNNVTTETAGMDKMDFGNALSDTFTILMSSDPSYRTLTALDYDPRVLEYKNIGRAKLIAPRNVQVQGHVWAYSSDGIAYTADGTKASAEFAAGTTEKTVAFEIPLESNEVMISCAIPVFISNPSASVEVSITVYRGEALRPIESVALTKKTTTLTGAASYTTPLAAISEYIEAVDSALAGYRAGYQREHWRAVVGVKLATGSAAANVKLGNLFVRKN